MPEKIAPFSWLREFAPPTEIIRLFRESLYEHGSTLWSGVAGQGIQLFYVIYPWHNLNGPLDRYVKLRVRMRRECFPATASKRSRHVSRHVRDARAVMHAGIAN